MGEQKRLRGAEQPVAPDDAIEDRAAQDHDRAALDTAPDGEPRQDIDYPADAPPNREGDITPSAPDPHVEWDERVQPERADRRADDYHEDIEKGA